MCDGGRGSGLVKEYFCLDGYGGVYRKYEGYVWYLSRYLGNLVVWVLLWLIGSGYVFFVDFS